MDLLSQGSERTGYLDLTYAGIERSSTHRFGQHHRDELFLATAENLHQVRWACVCICVYATVSLVRSTKALLFLSKWDESVITPFQHL